MVAARPSVGVAARDGRHRLGGPGPHRGGGSNAVGRVL